MVASRFCAEAGKASTDSRRTAGRNLSNFILNLSLKSKRSGEANSELEFATATVKGIMPYWDAIVQSQRRGTDGQVQAKANAVVIAERPGASSIERDKVLYRSRNQTRD